MSLDMGAAYLSPAEAAAIWRVSTDTVLRAIDRNDLPAIKYGRTVRIPRDEFDAFLASLRTDTLRARRRRTA